MTDAKSQKKDVCNYKVSASRKTKTTASHHLFVSYILLLILLNIVPTQYSCISVLMLCNLVPPEKVPDKLLEIKGGACRRGLVPFLHLPRSIVEAFRGVKCVLRPSPMLPDQIVSSQPSESLTTSCALNRTELWRPLTFQKSPTKRLNDFFGRMPMKGQALCGQIRSCMLNRTDLLPYCVSGYTHAGSSKQDRSAHGTSAQFVFQLDGLVNT